MARLGPPFSTIREILAGLVFFFACGYVQAPALAQRTGGHPGGGARFGGGAHINPPPNPPRVLIPPRSFGPTARMRVWSGPFPSGVASHGFYVRGRPLRPLPPTLPILPVPVFWGSPFFRFGLGFGHSRFWWPCAPYWGWGFCCSTLPSYGYGFVNYAAPFYVPPAYPYSGEERTLPRLYLKDGTMYEVTD